MEGVGLLELYLNGYGFFCSLDNNYLCECFDLFVLGIMIEKFSFCEGVMICGKV